MLNRKKIIFYLIWLGLISIGPITVLSQTPFSSVVDSRVLLVNFFQRILGLIAFSMIFVQIILGAFMPKWIEKLGSWVLKFHITEGLIIYSLIVAHPLSFVFFNYFIGKGFDPFYVFVDVCVLCGKQLEFFYNFGRIGFWLITTAVLAGFFRTQTPFLRLHWRKFHVLNYIAFLFIWTHSFLLGSDIGTPPFSYLHGVSLVIVIGIAIYKLKYLIFRN